VSEKVSVLLSQGKGEDCRATAVGARADTNIGQACIDISVGVKSIVGFPDEPKITDTLEIGQS